ncbi:hypothetical protein F2Q68_00016475 [Brassica cretica]|uniref:Uncharacterized protein n=1 Tax=Brassica cretica TaxID=69181 RepID=A0A8S9H8U5_BRACR|nr:hypothetical protein F2Q68_00016475 [Brassica cretica]
MPGSTRSNKESQLIFSPDPASLERTILPSTDSRSPLSTDNTNLLSTDILHPTSIDIPSWTSIDIEPRAMVAPLILVRDNNGELHDQEGHLRNATGREAARRRFRGRKSDEFWQITLVSIDTNYRASIDIHPPRSIDRSTRASIDNATESTASCNAVKILSHEEFAAKHPHPHSPDNVRIDRHANNNVDRHSEANIDRQPSPPINRRAPITYRVQMPKIDVERLNALRPKPKPQNNHQILSGRLQLMEMILWKKIGFLLEEA